MSGVAEDICTLFCAPFGHFIINMEVDRIILGSMTVYFKLRALLWTVVVESVSSLKVVE